MIRSALLLALLSAVPLSHAAPDLTTVSERSGFTATGRYDETIALCAAFQQAYPKQVQCIDFGTTPEGRPMKALVASNTGAFTPEAAKQQGLPVTLMQGGIHAGEIDGKDAGFLALREVLEGRAAKGALDKQVFIFVPVFNVDGHERFGKWNRPNQRGPVEMGWRTTAQNYNLNRDYLKADAPEMQAMLGLVNAWDPLTYVDLHATNGAKFQHDISIQVEPVYSGDEQFRKAGLALRTNVIKDIAKEGSTPQSYYMSFVKQDDPMSGFMDGVSDPRFSTGYFQLRNRMAMLVETHSWKEYPVRVRITRNTIVSVLDQVAKNGKGWLQAAYAADARAAKLGNQPVALSYKASDKTEMVNFNGYEYTRKPSEVSGALMTRYDESKPQVWRVPLRQDIVADFQITAPRAGYVVPAAYAAIVGEKLRQHGVAFRTLDKGVERFDGETFRADKATLAGASVEGHQRLTVEGKWKPESRAITPGSLFVPIAQPKARLVVAMLEPQAPDSLLAWGAFNTAFERKEYMEDYVAEDVAREQMAADPAVAKAFQDRLDSDPAFAKNPQARLEFFAKRHSSYDERLNLYPVLRANSAL